MLANASVRSSFIVNIKRVNEQIVNPFNDSIRKLVITVFLNDLFLNRLWNW